MMLVGNKTDLRFPGALTTAEGASLAIDHKVSFIETSALNGRGVEDAFLKIMAGKYYLSTDIITY
jgi:hypothetical protein